MSSGGIILPASSGASGANTTLSNLTSVTNINMALGELLDANGMVTVIWSGDAKLIDPSQVLSLDWKNRLAYSADTSIAIDWDARVLKNSNGLASIAWDAYGLRRQSGPASTTLMLYWGDAGILDVNDNLLSNALDPVSPQDAATKNYVDNRVRTFASSAGAGGASTQAMTVTGLLATDTIVAVTQVTPGANSKPLIGYSALGNNTLTANWGVDPGAGTIIQVSVLR